MSLTSLWAALHFWEVLFSLSTHPSWSDQLSLGRLIIQVEAYLCTHLNCESPFDRQTQLVSYQTPPAVRNPSIRRWMSVWAHLCDLIFTAALYRDPEGQGLVKHLLLYTLHLLCNSSWHSYSVAPLPWMGSNLIHSLGCWGKGEKALSPTATSDTV